MIHSIRPTTTFCTSEINITIAEGLRTKFVDLLNWSVVGRGLADHDRQRSSHFSPNGKTRGS